MLQTSSGGFFRGFAVRGASELLWGLPVRVMQGGGGGGGADNVHLCRVHSGLDEVAGPLVVCRAGAAAEQCR